MRRNVLVYGAVALLTMTAGRLFAVEADIDGATPGKWTMDLDAAKKVAAEKKLPIMLDFSGSDWCQWCQLMEANVFSKPEWQSYASNSLMTVLVDFPQDKSLVPDKYVERNKKLQEEYGIEGFPTFIILDSDGKTELGRLSAGRDKTPESFEAELKKLFSMRSTELAKFADTLSPEKKAEYVALTTKLTTDKQALKEQTKIIADANTKASDLQEAIEKTEEDIRMFKIAQQGADKLNEYKDLKTKLDAANKKLSDWINTDPEKNDDNIKLYTDMQAEIQKLEEALSKF